MQKLYENNRSLYWRRGLRSDPVNDDDFLSAKRLYQAFRQRSENDFKLRVENAFLQIYSNDKEWLLTLCNLTTKPLELWSPNNAYAHLLAKNVIIKSQPFPYEYKVSLQSRVDPSFANWVYNNQDKIKIGKRLLEYIESGSWVKSMYFYIRDEKVLQLVTLMIGNSIQRIDKIVCAPNIDK